MPLTAPPATNGLRDPLTGLPTPALVRDRLDHALVRRRVTTSTAVLVIDIGALDAGSETARGSLLVVTADRIAGSLRPADSVAHLGEGRFLVVLEDTDRTGARAVADRLLRILWTPVSLDGSAHPLTGHIGISSGVAGEAAGTDLEQAAEAAARTARETGREVVQADTEVDGDARAELARAIQEDQLVLHFLPTVELSSGRIVSLEALVRWEHPRDGLVMPGSFVPDMTRAGLDGPFGSWVLRHACRAAASLGLGPDTTVAVNVSAGQLRAPGFLDDVTAALADADLSPDRLVVETTGAAILEDIGTAERVLNDLRDLGAWITIDDFSSGEGSLSYLAHMPVDSLKIDTRAVADLGTSPEHASSALAVLEQCRALGIVTIAEGVEVAEQAAWLREHGCDRAQGRLWSEPLPVAEVGDLVRRAQDPASGTDRGSII